MDVWTYFEQKEKEFAELSLVPDRDPSDMFAELAGSNGRRGRIFGVLQMVDAPISAFIACSERVHARATSVTRDEYAYFLVVDGEEIFGYERDLSHNPPVHMHTRGHVRQTAGRMPFKKFVELAWEEVSSIAAGRP